MTGRVEPHRERRERSTPQPKRRLWITLLAVIPALFIAGTAGAVWTGYSLYDRPFAWYNSNRIAATAERAARDLSPPIVVVALGGSALRHATLDEQGMATLAAKHGVDGLHFLRIVQDHAQVGDFEPLLGDVLKLKPALVLLDVDLLFTERNGFAGLRRYGSHLTEVAVLGRPYLPDQIALQYAKPCRPTGPEGWTASAADRWVEKRKAAVRLDAASPAFDRVRRFADQARAAGTEVALLLPPRPAAVEERLYGAGNGYLPAGLDRLGGQADLPLWRYPDSARKAASFCRNGMLGPEGRDAYSAWLAGGIAERVAQPRVEEAALQ
ncbi:hypothetical protein [Roseomonas genomospecies 6]|uniref:Uncharacterized protein n=1 Tax=Roseomonas genomospecies 6 TaxID=214106 RepID=A0A9W7NJE8_9PROT|nr:hypothetical protein [Roseomonas genomospecies 6]KAA0680423.1 hypothetical protein DS843_14050 [Roseomonas genomospecies 6]